LENFIQPLLIAIFVIASILFFFKPQWVLFVFIGSLPLEALIEDSLFTLPKILGFLALLSFFVIVIKEKRKLHFDLPFLIMFLLVIWGSLSYFWSVSPDTTLVRITTLIQLLILYFLMINQVRSIKNLDLLLKFLFFGSIIYAMFGLSDLLLIISGNQNLRLASIAGNANGYFIVSICLIPAGYWIFTTSKNKPSRLFAVLVLFILLITSLYTQSRGGLISLTVFFFSIILFSKNKFSWLIVIILFVIVVLQFLPEGYLLRFEDIFHDLRITKLWPAGLRALQDQLLIGHGLGTNGYVITRYLGVNYLNYFLSVHNAFLGIGIELGLVGLLLYLSFIIFPTFRLIKLLIKSIRFENQNLKRLGIVIISVLFSFLISWVKGGGMEYSKFLWLIIGLISSLSIITRDSYYFINSNNK